MKRATVAFAITFAMMAGTARANFISLPPGASDMVALFAGSDVAFSFLFLEGAEPSGAVDFALPSPIAIELLDADGTTVSDRLTISTFSGSFESDADPGGLPPNPLAIHIDGESVVALSLLIQSDEDPGQPGAPSDVVTFLSPAFSTLVFPVAETPGETGFGPFLLTAPLLFDLYQPGTNIVSDRLIINRVGGTFVSDTDPGGLTPVAGAFRISEAGTVNAFSVEALSDTNDVAAVPEPTSLLLLGTGLMGFGARRRQRKATK